MQYSKTIKSNYDVSVDKARMSDICKDLKSCGLLQGVVEATYQCYFRVKRVMRRYPKALPLVQNVNHKPQPVTGLPGKVGSASGISIVPCFWSQISRMLYLPWTLLHFKKKDSRKEKRKAAVLSSRVFYSYAAALLGKLKAV